MSTDLRFLQLEVTAQCNLQCTHCYLEAGPKEKHRNKLGLDDYRRLAEEAYQLGARRVQIIGGEPALWPGTPQLLENLCRLGFDDIEYFSSFSLLPPKVETALRSVRASLAFTLFSHEPSEHDAITQKAGSWKATVSNISGFIGGGNAIRASVVAFDGKGSGAQKTIEFLKSLGISDVHVDEVRSIGRGGTMRPSVAPADSRSILHLAGELCGSCTDAKLYVAASGEVHFCGMARAILLGSARTHRLSEILASGSFNESYKELSSYFRLRHLSGHGSTACNPSARCNPELTNPCSPEKGRCGPEECSPIKFCNPQRWISVQPGRIVNIETGA